MNPTTNPYANLTDEEAIHYAYMASIEQDAPWIERLLAVIKNRDEQLKSVQAELRQVLDDLDSANSRD